MSEPKHAFEHRIEGRKAGRWYRRCSETCPLGDEIYISVTNATSIVSKPALIPAAARDTATAAWIHLPLMVATSRQPPEGIPVDGGKTCDKRSPVSTRCGGCRFCVNMAIKAYHRDLWESKADLGSRIHTHAYCHVIGQPIEADEEVEPFIGSYLAFYKEFGLDIRRDVVAAETTVIDRKVGVAGTGDVWIRFNKRQLATPGINLIDLKTSVDKPVTACYDDQVLQLAGLRYSPTTVLVDDTEMSTPKFAGAYLLNLRRDDFALIPTPADRDAHKAFVHAVGLQRFMKDTDASTWHPHPRPSRLPNNTDD